MTPETFREAMIALANGFVSRTLIESSPDEPNWRQIAFWVLFIQAHDMTEEARADYLARMTKTYVLGSPPLEVRS